MNKNVFISIVSHNQQEMVKLNFSNFPKKISKYDIHLSIMDNTGSEELEKFANNEELFYYHDNIQRGFGENHNKMFSLLNVQKDDIFIVCNPDIIIEPAQLQNLLLNFEKDNADILTPRVYFDKEKTIIDNPDKEFPAFLNFALSILSGKRLHYGTRLNIRHPKWISGAFMVIKADVYQQLGGFDENFFMYCEDMDLCYRANESGYKIFIDNKSYVIHETQMDSRNYFSKTMYWHIQSSIKFLMKHKKFHLLTNVLGSRKVNGGKRKDDF